MKTLAMVAMLTLISVQANADDWVVRKNMSSKNCFVVKSTALASPFPVLLATLKTQKDACEKAKSLKTDDDSADDKCPTYGPGTIIDCKAAGVDLK